MHARRIQTSAAGSSCSTGTSQSSTSAGRTRRPRRIASSSTSTPSAGPISETASSTRRSCTRISRRRRARRAPTSRTSGCGRASRTSSTRSGRTTWPPGRSRTARSRPSSSLRDAEGALHALRGMDVALIRVLAGRELDGPRLLPGERDGGRLVHALAGQMEVVDCALVLDLDLVRAGLDRLQVLPVEVDLDLVARAGLTDEARVLTRACVPRRGGGEEYTGKREWEQKATQHESPFLRQQV